MKKLVKLELPSPMLQWLRAFLTGGFQQVSVAGTTSTLHPVLSGVAQESLLRPLSFIFYVDDINGVNVSEKGSITQYADDICYTHPVTAAFQQDIDKIGSWATSSKLTLNESKTVWMLISK